VVARNSYRIAGIKPEYAWPVSYKDHYNSTPLKAGKRFAEPQSKRPSAPEGPYELDLEMIRVERYAKGG